MNKPIKNTFTEKEINWRVFNVIISSKKSVVIIASVFAALGAVSTMSIAEDLPGVMMAGGYPRARSSVALPASASPIQFAVRDATTSEMQATALVKRLSANRANLAVLMLERGKIIYEAHNFPSSETTPLMSFSMSKTLTAFTVGNMLCEGVINSIDSPAENYNSLLKGTVYGEASVKNLLMMTSGAKDADAAVVKPDPWRDITLGAYTLKNYVQKFKYRDSRLFGGAVLSGSRFVYSNTDTTSLGFLAEDHGGFINNFDWLIWKKIGAEGKGYWQVDKDGLPITYSGFSATARDWGRLALFSLDQLKNGSPCQRNFMTEATSPLISNTSSSGRSFSHYGYQTWIGNFGPRPSYWYVGYGGQRIGIDPEKERILIIFSVNENYMDDVYRAFGSWQRQ